MTHVGGGHEISPTARALLALEAIQNVPGITATRLGERLGVTERAARRYVAILREAGLPIDSVSGPYGGYQVGHGLRLPPLTFTAAEASGLVMAVLEGHKGAADPTDLVGGALAKIVRVLPARVAAQVRPIRDNAAGGTPDEPDPAGLVSLEVTTTLFESCAAARRLRLTYRRAHWARAREGRGDDRDREMEVDPWAVVLRRSRWYLLCWSHTVEARRVLRIDRIVTASPTPETFTPPAASTRWRSWRITCRKAGRTTSTSSSTRRRPRSPAGCRAAWAPCRHPTTAAAPGCARPPPSRAGTRDAWRCSPTPSTCAARPNCGRRRPTLAGGCSRQVQALPSPPAALARARCRCARCARPRSRPRSPARDRSRGARGRRGRR